MLKQASKQHCNITIGHMFVHLQATAVAPKVALMLSAVKFLDLWALDRPTCFFHLFQKFYEDNFKFALVAFSKYVFFSREKRLSAHSAVKSTHGYFFVCSYLGPSQ